MRFLSSEEDDLFMMMIDIATHVLDDVSAIVKRMTPLLEPNPTS